MRNIDEGIWRDEWFAEQEPIGKLIWIGLITKVADDQGRMLRNAHLIKSDLFPLSENPTAWDIDHWLTWFVTSEKIILYEVGGKEYMQLANWWNYQSSATWMSASKYPAPDGWQDCFQYRGKGGKLEKSPSWDGKRGGYFIQTDTNVPPNVPPNVGSNIPPLNDLYINVNDNKEEEAKKSEIPAQEPPKEPEPAKTQEPDPKTAEVFTFYQNNIEMLTQFNSERLGGLVDDYSASWVLEGLKDCVEYNGKSLKYLESILKGWKAHGFRVDTRPKNKKVFTYQQPSPLAIPENPPPAQDKSVPMPPELRQKMENLFKGKTP